MEQKSDTMVQVLRFEEDEGDTSMQRVDREGNRTTIVQVLEGSPLVC